MADLEAVLNQLAQRRPALIDLGLSRMKAVLEALGSPHQSLPPVLHVAGTNGKGSTIAYLKAILQAAGFGVHVYTSPHLVRYNERIELAGVQISDAQFIDLVEQCDRAAGDGQLSFFETLTCAAFLGFAQTPADFVILEVGLGGRLDATNVLDAPLASVITPIAMDHQSYLGDNLTAIANEKAGIMRRDVPAVIAPQAEEARTALTQAAQEVGARLFMHGVDYNAYQEQGRLIYQNESGLRDLSLPRLVGRHQIDNAGLAVAALDAGGVPLDDDTISKGLSAAVWPARMQRLSRGPLVEIINQHAPIGSELWLDGGHNPHAAQAVASALSSLEEKASARLVMIVGMQDNKDAEGFLAAFDGLASQIIAVSADRDHVADPRNIERAAAAIAPASRADDVRAAIEQVVHAPRGGTKEPLRILICGSLYLAGGILADHG